MQTECSAEPMLFARLDRRDLVADFDGGAISSDAGALLLGATDRAIGLVDRFATCFADGATPSGWRTSCARLRRRALAHTELARATCGTIRAKLLKIGALVTVSVRSVRVAMASPCPYADVFHLAHRRLCG